MAVGSVLPFWSLLVLLVPELAPLERLLVMAKALRKPFQREKPPLLPWAHPKCLLEHQRLRGGVSSLEP